MKFDGIKLNKEILDECKLIVKKLDDVLNLTIIQVGNNEISSTYVEKKIQACNYVGINVKLIKLNENISKEDLINIIEKLNNDNKVTGILVQLPLPNHLEKEEIIEIIDSKKDVDGFTSKNQKLLKEENDYAIIPPTALGVMEIIKRNKLNLKNKNILIIGKGSIAGQPIYELLKSYSSNVFQADINTKNTNDLIKKADVIIAAAGSKHLVKGSDIKNNSILIDVGITKENGKIFGDIEYENAKHKAQFITTHPGGTGPMTVCCVILNVIKCYNIQQGKW